MTRYHVMRASYPQAIPTQGRYTADNRNACCLELLRVGFTRLYRCRHTGGLLHRHFTLIPISIGTVSFLLHFPSSPRYRADALRWLRRHPVLWSSDFPLRDTRSDCPIRSPFQIACKLNAGSAASSGISCCCYCHPRCRDKPECGHNLHIR